MKIVRTNYCSQCKASDVPLVKYSKNVYNGTIYQYHKCRDCNSKKARAYYKTDKGRANIQKSIKKGLATNEGKYKHSTRRAVWYAIKVGKLVKPETCEHCGIKPDRLEGHHKDYRKKLDVTWLCTSCHAEADKKQKDEFVWDESLASSKQKISAKDVINIRELKSDGFTLKDIAKTYGISDSYVSRIISKQRFKNV